MLIASIVPSSVHDFADAPNIVFSNMLDLQDVMSRMGAPNNAHYWLAHYRPASMDITISKVMQDLTDIDIRPADDCVSASSCRKWNLRRHTSRIHEYLRAECDQAKRRAVYNEVQSLVIKQVPLAGLCWRT